MIDLRGADVSVTLTLRDASAEYRSLLSKGADRNEVRRRILAEAQVELSKQIEAARVSDAEIDEEITRTTTALESRKVRMVIRDG